MSRLEELAVGGDVDALVLHLAELRGDWGHAKRLRYARRLVNSAPEIQDAAADRLTRDWLYARLSPAPTDARRSRVHKPAFTTPPHDGRERRLADLTASRAEFNAAVSV